jgi:hypothetical protein
MMIEATSGGSVGLPILRPIDAATSMRQMELGVASCPAPMRNGFNSNHLIKSEDARELVSVSELNNGAAAPVTMRPSGDLISYDYPVII